MKYFFILGSNPTLSSAELAAIFDNTSKLSLIQTNIVILETDQEIMANIIKKIGGTIKFGLIHDEINPGNTNEVLNAIAGFAKPESSEAKFMFGLSSYGKNKTNLKPLAMEFKKLLKESGINSRWVISREPTLSSVVVEQNKLTTDRGVEIIIIQFNKKLLLGKTLAVQPFKELSFRDYGRPARDSRSGMLPPKLAKAMVAERLDDFLEMGLEVGVVRTRRYPEASITFLWYTQKLGYRILASYPDNDGRVILGRWFDPQLQRLLGSHTFSLT